MNQARIIKGMHDIELHNSDSLYPNETKSIEYTKTIPFKNNHQIGKSINYGKLYKKFHLLNLNNNDKNIQFILEEFFGKKYENVLENEIKSNKDAQNPNLKIEAAKEKKIRNYLTDMLKKDNQLILIKGFKNCQFCLSPNIF